MNNFFGNCFKALVDTACLPIDIAKDVITLGGAITNEECATKERLQKIYDELQEAGEQEED